VPRRDPDALAAAVAELLSDPARSKQMGEAGREHQRREFSLEAMVDRVEELYDTTLAGKRGSAPAHRRSFRSEARPAFELERFTTLETVREIWPTLADRSQNLFATWEWISTWWRHFGLNRPLVGAVAHRPGGEPAAILPMYVAFRRPVLVLRFLGHGPSDWLGPIYGHADRDIAAAALHETLDCVPGLDVVLAENVPAGSAWSSELGGTVLRRESFPILRFEGRTWQGVLAQRSSNFREQVRRKERRLARAHTLTYRLSDDPERLDADLDLLFRLHDARWKSAASGALANTRQAFHRDFARLAQARGWLRLWILELDGKPAAAWYGFRYAGVEWYYQAGRDPAYEADSVGFVLLCHTIRAALEDGAEAYWFLRGDEPFKRRFAEADPGLETLAIARSRRGRAAVATLAYVDRLPAAPRHWKRALTR
jgi:CelD/BcsL family acetyltransferase involved in cellulose biosynthesis